MFENSNIANEYGFSLLETLIALAIPPEQLKNLGFANDASFMEVPDLPKLIRLSVETSSSESNNHVIWIASIGGETRLPYKDDLTAKKYDF